MAVRAKIVQAFRDQTRWCDRLGSPFTARLLEAAARDLEDGGVLVELLGDWLGDPTALGDALPLRFAGALHALVLTGVDPDPAARYPPRVESADGSALWPAVVTAIARHRPFIREFLASPPQTNEPRRSAVLLGGFLEIARATSLPLRLLEIGASAGLNMIWDRYCYSLGSARWGDPTSSVAIAAEWSGSLPPLLTPVTVAQRAACDVAPIDIGDDGRCLCLKAYIWADQRDRLALLDRALARREGVRVERADAAPWIEKQLSRRVEGQATVLYHSIMWQYLPAATRERITGMMADAGRRASAASPLAWLRFEMVETGAPPELDVIRWPGGERRRLAKAHPHGGSVEWLGEAGKGSR